MDEYLTLARQYEDQETRAKYYDLFQEELLQSRPILSRGKEWRPTLPGMPPTLIHPPKGDAFAERNAYAMRIDYEKEPPMFQVTDTHYAATWLLDERAPEVKAPIGERRYGK